MLCVQKINKLICCFFKDTYRSRNILAVNDVTIESLNQTEKLAYSLSTTTTNRTNHERTARKICTNAAILELPSDGLTRAERKQGWVIIHLLIACYCFWFLATICDDYFVPAIENICNSFDLNEDVGKSE